MAGQTRPIWDFEDIGDYWKRADEKNIAPIIATFVIEFSPSENKFINVFF